jgi:hypothetical protein
MNRIESESIESKNTPLFIYTVLFVFLTQDVNGTSQVIRTAVVL